MAAVDETTSGRRVALPTALAGLVGTLAGTVVGGLISFAAVQANIGAEREAALRANRQEAYSTFVADADELVRLIARDFGDDQEIDPAELTGLEQFNLGVARNFTVAYLIASDAVTATLGQLDEAIAEFGDAAVEGDESNIEDSEHELNNAIDAFRDAAREDLLSAG